MPRSRILPSRSLLPAILLAAALAGCVTPGPGTGADTSDAAGAPGGLAPGDIEAPTAAEVADVPDGLELVWSEVPLPFHQDIPVPEGATIVDLQVRLADGDRAVYPALFDGETEASRCVTPFARGWTGTPTGTSSCAGVAVVDERPTTWTARVTAPAGDDEEAAVAEAVTVTLHDGPLDGVAARVDTGNLSRAQHEVGETTTHEVESHDGSALHVTVHRPAGGDTHPTLLISTPYNTLSRVAGATPYEPLVRDHVQRGYAVAVADVRGFGQSDGCVEVWGPNERRDQAVLVDWITSRDWSTGKVGMMGASYPGTTPVEAAVEAPDGLEAIVPVASVVNAYQDWHYGGVPNGENLGSPAAYHAIGTATTPRPTDPVDTARDVGNGLCYPHMTGEANDPRAIHDDFYEDRNFKTRVDRVEAAVLQQHGFVDGTVKPSMIPGWFNELDVPKLGLFGHWAHNYAVRADTQLLELAWLDQFVRGRDVGLDGISQATVETNERYRSGPSWPPADASTETLHADLDRGVLAPEPAGGEATLLLDPTGALGAVADADEIALPGTVDETVALAGAPAVRLDFTLEDGANGYVRAELWDATDDRLVTYGAVNLAHRGDHTSYEPFAPGEDATLELPLQPAEYTLHAGDDVQLVLRASQASGLTRGSDPGEIVLHGGQDGTALLLPAVPADAYGEVPISVDPSPAH